MKLVFVIALLFSFTVIIHLLCLLLIQFSSYMVVAANNNIHVETANFGVDVTGNQNVPKYEYYLLKTPNKKYSVMFDTVQEATADDGTGTVPGSDEALASLTWVYSAVTEINGEATFTITSGPSKRNGHFSSIVVNNHLNKGSTANSTTIRFDLRFNNFNFIGGNNSRLVISFNLEVDSSNIFEIVNTANFNGPSNGVVNAFLVDGGQKKSIVYGHFPSGSQLVHDSTLGINGPLFLSAVFSFSFSAVLLALLLSILSTTFYVRLYHWFDPTIQIDLHLSFQ